MKGFLGLSPHILEVVFFRHDSSRAKTAAAVTIKGEKASALLVVGVADDWQGPECITAGIIKLVTFNNRNIVFQTKEQKYRNNSNTYKLQKHVRCIKPDIKIT